MKIHFTVHVYAEEKLYDEVLIPHSRNYGIVGKNIIAPLRKINEYSRAMKSHFRKFGNQMSGSGNHLCNYASLLA